MKIPHIKLSDASTGMISRKNKIRIIPNFSIEPDWYDIKEGRRVVGNATLILRPQQMAHGRDLTYFPQSWVTSDDMIKPYLSVSYIELSKEKGARHRGLGRRAMQLIYEMSKKTSAEGRIALRSQQQPAGFYSHLGFDIPEGLKKVLDVMYDTCLEIATAKKMTKKAFNDMLKEIHCPQKSDGRFNVAGLRFFTPTEDNLSILFRKSHNDKAVK